MTTSISISTAAATLLCQLIQDVSDLHLQSMLRSESTGHKLWNHTTACDRCRNRCVALSTTRTKPESNSKPVYFLEAAPELTGWRIEGDDRIFDSDGYVQGIALGLDSSASGFSLFTMQGRELVLTEESPRKATLILRLRLSGKGNDLRLEGDLPAAAGELILDGARFQLVNQAPRVYSCRPA